MVRVQRREMKFKMETSANGTGQAQTPQRRSGGVTNDPQRRQARQELRLSSTPPPRLQPLSRFSATRLLTPPTNQKRRDRGQVRGLPVEMKQPPCSLQSTVTLATLRAES